jgi:hypothetical protein
MNLGLWAEFTLKTALGVVWRMFVNGLGGAFAGFFAALIYNAVAGIMGGIVINLEDKQKQQVRGGRAGAERAEAAHACEVKPEAPGHHDRGPLVCAASGAIRLPRRSPP